MLDTKILLWIQARRFKPLSQFLILITYTGTGRAWFIGAATLNGLHFVGFRYLDNQEGFLRALLAPLIAWFVGSILKRRFARPRPSLRQEGIVTLVPNPSCGSFPSSHTSSTFSFFFALILIGHPLAPIVGLWALLVSFSRIYLGVHYPSDIAGGVVVAIFCSLASQALLQVMAQI